MRSSRYELSKLLFKLKNLLRDIFMNGVQAHGSTLSTNQETRFLPFPFFFLLFPLFGAKLENREKILNNQNTKEHVIICSHPKFYKRLELPPHSLKMKLRF